MRAGAVKQAEATGAVAKEHQVLAEQAQRFDGPHRHARVVRRIELGQQRGGLPIAAHERAARRAGPDARDKFVLFRLHAIQSTECAGRPAPPPILAR